MGNEQCRSGGPAAPQMPPTGGTMPKKSSSKPTQSQPVYQGSGRVESVLFIFGPPGPEARKAQVREWAAAQGRSESQVFFDFVQKKLTDWCAPEEDGTTGLDYFVSRA